MGTASPTTREVSHSSSSITMATIRQNYSEECEALVNKYVNTKLYHSYVYLYMSSYFNRDDQALTGFADFFWKASEEEHRHAAALMEYQTKREVGWCCKTLPSPPLWSGGLLSRRWLLSSIWRRRQPNAWGPWRPWPPPRQTTTSPPSSRRTS